jgi:hypothetical protein
VRQQPDWAFSHHADQPERLWSYLEQQPWKLAACWWATRMRVDEVLTDKRAIGNLEYCAVHQTVPPVASQSAGTGGDGNQVHPLPPPVASIRGKANRHLRREYLDHTFFWTMADLENKLLDFRTYFNNHRTHTSLEGTPDTPVSRPIPNLRSFRWQPYCRALRQTPVAA